MFYHWSHIRCLMLCMEVFVGAVWRITAQFDALNLHAGWRPLARRWKQSVANVQVVEPDVAVEEGASTGSHWMLP